MCSGRTETGRHKSDHVLRPCTNRESRRIFPVYPWVSRYKDFSLRSFPATPDDGRKEQWVVEGPFGLTGQVSPDRPPGDVQSDTLGPPLDGTSTVTGPSRTASRTQRREREGRTVVVRTVPREVTIHRASPFHSFIVVDCKRGTQGFVVIGVTQ